MFLSELLPRNKVGMMFHFGDGNFVSGMELIGQRIGKEIQRFGGVSGENYLVGRRGMYEPCSDITDVFVFLGRTFGDCVETPRNIGRVVGIISHKGVDDTLGFQRRSHRIKIYKIWVFLKYGEEIF